jgi:glucose 1-dehydrogenase
MQVSPRVTVVTGGSRGIGAATCQRLAVDGHDLVIGYASDADAAESVAAAVRGAGRRAKVCHADVTVAAAVRELFDAAAEFGAVTGLVNNAGVIAGRGAFVGLAEADLRRVVEVNVIGAMLCAQEAVRRMAPGGAIVNVSSAASTLGSPGEYVHYAASKAALDTLTIGLSKELGPAGIRVNAVSPGIIRTGIHEEGRLERLGPQQPLGRAGEPEEVAAAIAWLLSDEASYVTGTNLRVAGGR